MTEYAANPKLSPNIAVAPQWVAAPLYALINPFFGEPPEFCEGSAMSVHSLEALREQRAQGWQREVWVASNPGRHALKPASLPYLVALHGDRDPLLGALCALAVSEHEAVLAEENPGHYRVGNFLQTSLEPALLMQYLETMWSYRSPFPGQARYLNMGDRRLLELVFNLLPAANVSAWLGPIACWHLLGRDCVWYSRRGAQDETQFSEEDSYRRQRLLASAAAAGAPNLTSTEAEHQVLMQAEAMSRCLTLWQQLGVLMKPTRHAQALAAVQAARAAGHTQPTAQAEYAAKWICHPTPSADEPAAEV